MDRDEIFSQVEALQALTQRTGMNAEKAKKVELEGFMAIFHPDHKWHDLPPVERHGS